MPVWFGTTSRTSCRPCAASTSARHPAPPPPARRTARSAAGTSTAAAPASVRPLQHHQRAGADRDDAARVDHLAVVEIWTAGVEHDMPRAAVVGVRHVEVDRLAVRGEAQQERLVDDTVAAGVAIWDALAVEVDGDGPAERGLPVLLG